MKKENAQRKKRNVHKSKEPSKPPETRKRKKPTESGDEASEDSELDDNKQDNEDVIERVAEKDYVEEYDDADGDNPQEEREAETTWSWISCPINPIEQEKTRHGTQKGPRDLLPKYCGRKLGSVVTMKKLTSPSEYMELFWDDHIITTFCEETNSWTRNENVRGWRDVDAAEMKGFWALILFMGVLKLPERRFAWDNSAFGSQYCQTSLSYGRFEQILKALHWKDASQVCKRDREKLNRAKS